MSAPVNISVVRRAGALRLLRGTARVPAALRGGVVTIGTFDGLHLGHQALIERTIKQARATGRAALMLTFEPMPREFLHPASPPARLTNLRERWRLLDFEEYRPVTVRPNDKGKITAGIRLRAAVSRFFFEDRVSPVSQLELEEAAKH